MRLHYTQAAVGDNAVRERLLWRQRRDVSPGACSKALMSIGCEKKSEPFAMLALLMGKVNYGLRNIL
jgi:hypothetical protein